MKRKFNVLALLSVVVFVMGIAVPAYIYSDQAVAIGGPQHTPRPTSTRFSQPLTEIIQVAEAEEPQSEDRNSVTDCTYPLYYWREYPDSWPEQIVIAAKVYRQSDMFDIFNDQHPDSAILVIRQLYTAFLNILGGASHASIDRIIVEANNWLVANQPGSAISETNQQIGFYLVSELEKYNDGTNGPAACEDVPPLPTALPTATITKTPVPTFTPVSLIRSLQQLFQPGGNSENQYVPPTNPPTPTATQTKKPPTPIPTSTPIPPPTSTPTPPPTSTPTRRPTNTPKKPTDTPITPTYTNTPVPPTDTNTPLPPTETNTPLPPTSTDTPGPADESTPTLEPT